MKNSKDKSVLAQARRYPRRTFDKLVAILYRGRSGFENSVEISEGGILLQADRQYHVGDTIEICVVVPGHKFQIVIGTIAYVRGERTHERMVGIRFRSPAADVAKLQEAIRKYVNSDGSTSQAA